MEPHFPPFFFSPEAYSEKLSVTVSSRSLGCSTAIESLIPALTAQVLQLYAAVPTREGVFTNNIIVGGV